VFLDEGSQPLLGGRWGTGAQGSRPGELVLERFGDVDRQLRRVRESHHASNTWAAIRGAATAGQETALLPVSLIAKDVDEGRMTLFACQCGSRSRDHLHFRNRAFRAPPLVVSRG
jgi:hypothetical protein